MLQSFGYSLLQLILSSCFGCGDFAFRVLWLLVFRLKEARRGREKARFLQLKGLFLLSLGMPRDFIAFPSSLTQQ